MHKFRADLRELDKFDLTQITNKLPSLPGRRVLSPIEVSALKSALLLGRMTGLQSNAPLLYECVKVSDEKTAIEILNPMRVPVGLTDSPISDITVGLCGSANLAFFGPGIGTAFGIYFSTVKEIGVFVNPFVGAWTNFVNTGAGPTAIFVCGPPSTFDGISYGVGVDVSVSKWSSITGMLLFSAPPLRFLGFAVGVSWGLQALEVDITVQAQYTKTYPIIKGN